MTKEKLSSPVFKYFSEARKYYPMLGIAPETKYKNKCFTSKQDDKFLEIIGVAPSTRLTWYSNGIRAFYWKVLGILEELRITKAERDNLQRQLDEITKK